MRITALFVDFDSVDDAMHGACLIVPPALLAQNLRRSAKLLTGELVAFVGGRRVNSDPKLAEVFQNEGYELLPFSQDAEQTRRCLQERLTSLLESDRPPDVVVLVTQDEGLAVLARRLAESGVDVRVWSLACAAPPTLCSEALQFYTLEELLHLRVGSRALFIDFENIAFCLYDLGYVINPAVLARQMRERAAQGGSVQAFAYADWQRLPPMQDSSGRNIGAEAQRIFELNHIVTRYLISRAGKNTADMRIADDIRTLLQDPNCPDTFIIASGDRDFAPVIDTLLRHGKEVIVWGVRGKTSHSLPEAARVEYIQEFLPLTLRATQHLSTESAWAPLGTVATTETLPGAWTSLILLLDDLMRRNHWQWVSFSKLVMEASRTGRCGMDEEDARNLINQAIGEGFILRERIPNPNPNYPDQFIWSCRPNDERKAVRAARLVLAFVTDCMWRSVIERGWDYVAFSFLLKEMANAPELALPGFNMDDNWRAAWIHFLAAENRLRLERRPHPKNRRDLMKALTLPEQDMLVRIIVSVDNFCYSRSTSWEAASALLQYLACFGVEMVRAALASGEKYGALRLAKYPHPTEVDRPATTGISLNTDVPFVARTLERRNSLLRALYAAQERCQSFWDQDILAIAGEKASLWRSILVHERLIQPIDQGYSNGRCYVLSHNHAVVRKVCGLAPEETDARPLVPLATLDENNPEDAEAADRSDETESTEETLFVD